MAVDVPVVDGENEDQRYTLQDFVGTSQYKDAIYWSGVWDWGPYTMLVPDANYFVRWQGFVQVRYDTIIIATLLIVTYYLCELFSSLPRLRGKYDGMLQSMLHAAKCVGMLQSVLACCKVCCMLPSMLHAAKFVGMLPSILRAAKYVACCKVCCMLQSMLHVAKYVACCKVCCVLQSTFRGTNAFCFVAAIAR